MKRAGLRYGLLALLMLAVPVVATASEVSVPANYPTIGAAISAVGEGSVIVVAPGQYIENLVIAKPVTVRGSTDGQVVLSPAKWQEPTVSLGAEAKGVVIENLRIVDGYAERGLSLAGASAATVSGCAFVGNYIHVRVCDSANLAINNCEFGEYYESAVEVENTASISVSGSSFTSVAGTVTVTITEDAVGVFDGCSFKGLGSLSPDLRDKAVWSNGWNGTGKTALTFKNSSIVGYFIGLVSQQAGFYTVEDCHFENCFSSVQVWNMPTGQTRVSILANSIIGSTEPILLGGRVEQIEISDNVITEAPDRGIVVITSLSGRGTDAIFIGQMTGSGNIIQAAKPLYPPEKTGFWPKGFVKEP